ncbi:hypothetical protein H7J71_23080 [Mycolicibacterium peregrinum]|uniref:hypothetical protein n=1 Tax=Mycolicibacterium peregrinum TaxID=43304 RepID=UPI0006D764BB|nr:hypothetical protein [Mycolicibacterium peregrinum]MCV7204902.1 hypothetical protein [Mycolicibacterium peregrinum]ORW59518.1 hypothetical protein AWC21_12455 [Mycolicibacterium peregrinum]
MTDDNEVAIHDRKGFLAALDAIDELQFAPLAENLTTIPGATDGSDTAATVAKILADAQTTLAASDKAIAGAVTDLRAVYKEVTGSDTSGETRVLEA